MARYDPVNDVTPQNLYKRPSLPSVTAMRTALNTFNATSYSNDRLETMTELDMVYACRVHNLTVIGLP